MQLLDANPRAVDLTGTHAPPHDVSVAKWCRYLARGGRLTLSGMYFSVERNAGPITFAMVQRLQAEGFIMLEHTGSHTPALPHVRAVLTSKGRILAAAAS